jgi:hypothetical protein
VRGERENELEAERENAGQSTAKMRGNGSRKCEEGPRKSAEGRAKMMAKKNAKMRGMGAQKCGKGNGKMREERAKMRGNGGRK